MSCGSSSTRVVGRLIEYANVREAPSISPIAKNGSSPCQSLHFSCILADGGMLSIETQRVVCAHRTRLIVKLFHVSQTLVLQNARKAGLKVPTFRTDKLRLCPFKPGDTPKLRWTTPGGGNDQNVYHFERRGRTGNGDLKTRVQHRRVPSCVQD